MKGIESISLSIAKPMDDEALLKVLGGDGGGNTTVKDGGCSTDKFLYCGCINYDKCTCVYVNKCFGCEK